MYNILPDHLWEKVSKKKNIQTFKSNNGKAIQQLSRLIESKLKALIVNF